MNRSRKLVWCAIWLLCGAVTLGSRAKTDFVTPDLEWPQAESQLSAILLLSDEPDDVLRSWTTPSAGVPVKVTDTITRGLPIVAFVFFAGCQPDAAGQCNASVDFTILEPDGSEYASFRDRELWKQKPAPPEGTLRLSAEYVGVVIEPGDPLGRYEFQVTVRDLNGGTTVELNRAFTAIAGGK
jgi:hypothetical protein